MYMKKISDIPENGIHYNDGSFVYYIEHYKVSRNQAGDTFGLIYMKMSIEQSNRSSLSNVENLKKLCRSKCFYRTQKETIKIIGRTTEDKFYERVEEYINEITSLLDVIDYTVLLFQSASTIGAGYTRDFKNGREMKDFFNEIKKNFGDVL